ncbi:sugar phosphate isomerase/epimerase [Neobacillus notoginsengisoli]|uniref:Sugar phosphate isomerase/epimerase n=1 Tax=Neobacillus notoginsengisoli TaxID=1578198 RepID=A0A417YYM8_9BACI|nr:sugar phosphate isomerase/epimerase family protein [Neobacillus notoginsengisoli]RHW42637.1 sugar phosphate isomerase/epimerase [Neobacillus notoginsengisoli]
MKLGTQNQAFFPEGIKEKFLYLKEAGIDAFEIDGKLLVERLDEVKEAMAETGIEVPTVCGGYTGWIGDFIEERRLNGLEEIKEILYALKEIGGKGIVVPAAWGMFTYRLPPMVSPRSSAGDRKAVSESLQYLDMIAKETGTMVLLEPLNRYQDHMINTVSDARTYIEEYNLQNCKVAADFYHMNIEEDGISQTLHLHKDIIGHIHVADNHRYQPGSGSIDFGKHFNQLRKDGYKGYIMFEGRLRGEHPETAFLEGMNHLKRSLS